MFVPPQKTVDPEALVIANSLLEASNRTLANLMAFRKEQFQAFWYDGRRMRTVTEINAILEQMDAAQPGQSARFFGSAKELVELILAISPNALQDTDWYPRYPYVIDPTTYSLRVYESAIELPSEEQQPAQPTDEDPPVN